MRLLKLALRFGASLFSVVTLTLLSVVHRPRVARAQEGGTYRGRPGHGPVYITPEGALIWPSEGGSNCNCGGGGGGGGTGE